MEKKDDAPSDKNLIPVLCSALKVIERIAESRGDSSTKAIATALDIKPSTCYRITKTLIHNRWIRSNEDGQFELSFGVLKLLKPLLRYNILIDALQKPLRRLAYETEMCAKLVVLQGGQAVTIYKEDSPTDPSVTLKVGTNLHPLEGSAGPVLISELSEIEIRRLIAQAPSTNETSQDEDSLIEMIKQVRKDGYRIDNTGTRFVSIGAPVRDYDNNILAAIAILGLPDQFEGARMNFLTEAIQFAAAGCSQIVSGRRISPR